jgi:hypothetical protein
MGAVKRKKAAFWQAGPAGRGARKSVWVGGGGRLCCPPVKNMKVTLNWLKQYVDLEWSPAELAERLPMLGIEVATMEKVGGEFEGIVVAQVLTRDKVPGSDKLSVCKVNDGKGERTIICGAQNHQPGDKVPLILPNFALPLKAGEKTPLAGAAG